MLGVKLDHDMETRLERVARRTGMSKSEITRQALERYLRRAALTPKEARQVVAALAGEKFDGEFWEDDAEGWV